jgi:hypothetical protein
VGSDAISSSSPATLLNGLASNGLNTTSHINDLEDELKVLRQHNRKLKVNSNSKQGQCYQNFKNKAVKNSYKNELSEKKLSSQLMVFPFSNSQVTVWNRATSNHLAKTILNSRY